jgi:hypothetical protein
MWQSDITDARTFVIYEINPSSGVYSHFTIINDLLYSSADDGLHVSESYKMYGKDK